ncbi:hypothetical protein [Marisediminicola senii]|uniref:hypothetical protein n=1 Tax=Marisediminicola senii TaxID=2711233 RepID=UPI0013EDB1B3|nr:hypothetical protein [Marisediminicola senii]
MTEFRNHLLAAGRGVGTVDMYAGRIAFFARSNPNVFAVTTAELEQFLADRRQILAAESRALVRFLP